MLMCSVLIQNQQYYVYRVCKDTYWFYVHLVFFETSQVNLCFPDLACQCRYGQRGAILTYYIYWVYLAQAKHV